MQRRSFIRAAAAAATLGAPALRAQTGQNVQNLSLIHI